MVLQFFFVKFSSIKFNQNRFIRSVVFSCAMGDRVKEGVVLISALQDSNMQKIYIVLGLRNYT
jgi:hypothetical protein